MTEKEKVEEIYNKLTRSRTGGLFGRTWKHRTGHGDNANLLTPVDKAFLCDKVVNGVGDVRKKALKIYGHIYNAGEDEARRRCSPADDDEDEEDEASAASFADATASGKMNAKRDKKNKMVLAKRVEGDQYGGRRRRRRKSRRKKKSRKSKRRKGLNSKKRRRRKRRTKKR